MTYNILCGGLAKVNGEERLNSILETVQDCAPDILALQEANHFESPELAKRFSKALLLPYYALAEAAIYEDGERYNVIVFSRYPISKVYRFPDCQFQSAAISVMLETPVGKISICNAHLHAFSETHRVKELGCILAYQCGFQDQLFVGDMNAISRSDTYADDATEFELNYEVTDMLNREFTDVFAATSGPDQWTHPSRIKADHTRKVFRRIDYVFASPSLSRRVVRAKVITSEKAHRASDHFPLIVEFE
ncbi:endonuclease/exonuclease/phosphatase family protein [Pseudohalocynthiibacter aestuariivivens]|uniref:Endonuclease/exonuclease/phosphatase family protein n=1 Tax=Pseudohalocynthiibacter aestuariivivens TaxID=1591409 RepID=A0ABV5JIF2_9RHOB|nr:endonuclease/exonuclease/phosphatase family protein [Pseudohalocynthiibacter aestuariivivens]MBS9716472.1 endonuclease/exonuclease/phosphatase family protein [Pseudohalocynthiibacter aestuariivivens]